MRNFYKISGDITELFIHSETYGKFTIQIDTSDIPIIKDYRWFIKINKSDGIPYASTNMLIDGKRNVCRMHRLIMGCKHKDGQEIDHKNNNTLDNRKNNLRSVTSQQNSRNTRKTKRKSTSKYKGVSKRSDGKWQANICIGSFNLEKDAARAYNEIASMYFGEYASLNNIEQELVTNE